jgi:type I restriction enzyme S subunit
MKYHLYKSSEVEWVKEVPSHWDFLPFNLVLNESKLKLQDINEDLNLLSLSGEKGISYKRTEDEVQTRTNEELSKYNVVRIGQIVMNPLVNPLKLDYFGFSLSKIQGVVSPVYMVFDSNQSTKYIEWYFKSHLTIQYLLSNSKGIRPLSLQLSRETLKGIKILVPPFQEQLQIVQFLDNKTELIDKLISIKERKIILLNEQTTSLINQVVTKGLNPNVKMKESGVEWIGDIPDGWKLGKIKFLSKTISKGTTPSTIGRSVLDEGPVYYVKIEDFEKDSVSIPNTFIDEETNGLLKRSSLEEGDILFVITGSTTGKNVILPKELVPSNTNQNVSFIRLKNKDNVRYTWYWLSSELIQNQVRVMNNISTLPSLSMEDLGNFFIPLPIESEQYEIVEYLDSKTKKIDDLIQMEQKKIDLLKEYRQSLISEVVTGKIKVTTDE